MVEALKEQKDLFRDGQSRDLSFRRDQLLKLGQMIKIHEEEICEALAQDLGRPYFEGYVAEVAAVLEEVNFALKNLKKWARSKKKSVPFYIQPAKAWVQPEPYGHVLIISPWNYPISLTLVPLIGAVAAGNVVAVKPSELTPNCSAVLRKMLEAYFDSGYVQVFEGGQAVAEQLLEQPFDYIFFTGSPRVGKIVMEKASRHLTPVTLELGGKSPCLVDATVPLSPTARRICWGKFMNAGQTCIAPDYLVVERSVAKELIAELKQCVEKFYSSTPLASKDLAHIVILKHFDRLKSYLDQGEILWGGDHDVERLRMAPTLIRPESLESPLMTEEIFGPILPVVEVESLKEAGRLIERNPKPLALYLFSEDRNVQKEILERESFGGGCLNDILKHVGLPNLPFGGVGASGFGNYHGEFSFQTFSHYKSLLKRPLRFDPSIVYPPYSRRKLRWLKRMF